jgi:hypothetical protein
VPPAALGEFSIRLHRSGCFGLAQHWPLGVNACLIQRIRLGIEFPLRDLQELGQIDFLAAFADQFFPGTCVRSLPLTEMSRLFSHSRDGSS